MTQDIGGLKVDAQAIAEGLYAIICERGEEALVAFGMIPKWIMDMADRLVREKIVSVWASQMECTVEEVQQYIDKAKLDALTNQTMRAIGSEIYGAAKRAGKMVV